MATIIDLEVYGDLYASIMEALRDEASIDEEVGTEILW